MESDLFTIYNRFQSSYDGHLVSVTTSYKPIGTIYIKFDILQLPHLLGLHKIYRGSSPKEIIAKLASGKISTKSIRWDKNYGAIKDRIAYFSCLDDILKFGEDVSAILVNSEDSRNSMRLDLVFQHVKSHRRVSLGIRETHDGIYAPVTFLVRQDRTIDFPNSKRLKYHVDGWF
ncbi:PBECR4 domain-containing protein [Lacticaseibacillus suibinensis]|uniref:PBECR4 domain-containing protein n=1 Tax=Lacticaseibacillus suibinensis TaxID=2486011 RepID=UPI000F7A140E|nr:PBECR4 domain-containing protein [Lacticaseibacillus suibinensis]